MSNKVDILDSIISNVNTEKEAQSAALREIVEQLYSMLLEDNRRFSDWEYQFISDMYSRDDLTYLTERQVYHINRLKDKYINGNYRKESHFKRYSK